MTRSLWFKITLISGLFTLAILVYVGIDLYNRIYRPNVVLKANDSNFFFIHTGATYQNVLDSLTQKGIITNRNTFDWVAEKKHYKHKIKPGRYRIESGMSNDDLVNLLRSGNQSPLKLTIQNHKSAQHLAGYLSHQLELDSLSFLRLLQNPDTLKRYGFNTDNILCMFIPNTYEFYWNTDAYKCFKKMHREYQKYWSTERLEKASKIGLSNIDVCILASIVQQESYIESQKPTIAGVYINRLRKGMALQSDPTLIFAIGDYTIRRVLNSHKSIESPYNTYKHKGLPPGPIIMPDPSSQNAVLNYEKHAYLFFCAREDFSGYHNFAETYAQHLVYARRYQYALDTSKIYN